MTAPTHDMDAPIATLAEQYGFSEPAVRHLFEAIAEGGGDMALFDHPELQGPGQWMRGGLLLTTTPADRVFNNRIEALCNALSGLYRRQSDAAASSHRRVDANARAWDTTASAQQRWWPSDWGEPAASGALGNYGYAFFDGAQRLAIRHGDDVALYETGGHHITGIAHAQPDTLANLVLTTPSRELPLVELRPCAAQASDVRGSAGGDRNMNNILQAIEKLGALHREGVLSDEEFAANKRELLARL